MILLTSIYPVRHISIPSLLSFHSVLQSGSLGLGVIAGENRVHEVGIWSTTKLSHQVCGSIKVAFFASNHIHRHIRARLDALSAHYSRNGTLKARGISFGHQSALATLPSWRMLRRPLGIQ